MRPRGGVAASERVWPPLLRVLPSPIHCRTAQQRAIDRNVSRTHNFIDPLTPVPLEVAYAGLCILPRCSLLLFW
jgi:hypothetical protein